MACVLSEGLASGWEGLEEMSNQHLVTNYWDLENNVFKSEPDDFILPEDDGGGQRQRDADLRAEIKRIQNVLDKALKNPLFKKQAD